MRRPLRVVVQNSASTDTVPRAADLRKWITAAAGPGRTGELTLRIVDEAESAALNERYRARRGPTNVLAFPADGDGEDWAALPEADEDPLPIGDLVVCAPVVEREAEEQGKTLAAHWAHIVMHGTLHLVGYDHDDDEEAREMEDRERELLAVFGFGDPYSVEAQ